MAEYKAAAIATREKTARLRKLRLAKEAAERKARATTPATKKSAAKKSRP
jgi:hypothetical protein